ncbi:MAG: Asp-tRNA(Asn)/Glu-tRNA(Gln) amidotransferase subunit GatC [Chloroflexota bacterium]|nr:MAG: Asp-tRNA(Asn)/Glu-tRNA(Gln) amidotransferase subunit GatC [Chloroflexota bacterium]
MTSHNSGDPGTLTVADVERVAVLARLALTAPQIETLRSDLASILQHVAALDELDTSAISPATTVVPLDSVMADDVVMAGLSSTDVLRNAPAVIDGQFQVPPVFEDQ